MDIVVIWRGLWKKQCFLLFFVMEVVQKQRNNKKNGKVSSTAQSWQLSVDKPSQMKDAIFGHKLAYKY